MKKHGKKGEELVKMIPELKKNNLVEWKEEGGGKTFMLLCELLKGNAIPTKGLNLGGDQKKREKEGREKNKNNENEQVTKLETLEQL